MNIKDTLEAVGKTPFRILLLLPSIAFLGMAAFLVYKDKEPIHFVGFATLGALFFLLVRRQLKEDPSPRISSDEWLRRIAVKLEDCGSAHIYLRKFDHPDNFKVEHREALLKIMQAIQRKLVGGADISIVAFHPDSKEKSGLDWLRANIGRPMPLEDFIIIRTAQWTTNSSSVYIFDDRTIFYNMSEKGKVIYKEENFASSIVHDLIIRGFSNLVGGQK
jgi:hypothetical protein